MSMLIFHILFAVFLLSTGFYLFLNKLSDYHLLTMPTWMELGILITLYLMLISFSLAVMVGTTIILI
jgi:hypothetical protein